VATHPQVSEAPRVLREAAFPSDVLRVLATLRSAGHAAYLVGGCLRDLLRGQPAKDFDVATSAHAEAVMKLFRRVIPTGVKHGTVTVLAGSFHVEVTTFRGEGEYQDARRPADVVFLADVASDLARRDFTINAMAYDPATSEFVDPFDGAADLARGLVRCVGDPLRRFSEDGLRPLRAVRFASVLGFRIDEETRRAIPATRSTFERVAKERVREEIEKILMCARPGTGIALLREVGLLSHVLPQLVPLADAALEGPSSFPFMLRRLDLVAPRLEARLAALLLEASSDLAEPHPPPDRASQATADALDGLRFPRKTIELASLLVREQRLPFEIEQDDRAVRRALARIGPDALSPLIEVARATAYAVGEEALERRVEEFSRRTDRVLAERPPLRASDLALDGARIMQLLGEQPGPRVGEALRFLLDQVIEDPRRNSPETLEALLRTWARTSIEPT
jgi:tRNA nucleotidyltransferase (CCA-adding enzyme)